MVRGGSGKEGELVAAAFEAKVERPFEGGFDFGGGAGLGGAVLEGGESIAVEGGVGIGGIGIEILADHEDGFAMRVDAFAEEADVGREDEVAGDSAGKKVEGVGGAPDVSAAAGDAVFAGGRVVGGRAGKGVQADVRMGIEEAGLGQGGPGGAEREEAKHAVSISRMLASKNQ